MPMWIVKREIEYCAIIEAPTQEAAVEAAKGWEENEWGAAHEDTTTGYGKPYTATRPDFTVDLQGKPHEHFFDDEDTGGCIYCDALPEEKK